jgi:hypothetical protein
MDFVSEWGFDVKKGQTRAFQEWVRENEAKLAQEAPDGWEYLGTYGVVATSEKESGAFRQVWRHRSYADMDTFAEALRQPGTLGQLMDEMTVQFVDDERGANWSQSIYKAVVDTSFVGD